MEGNKTYAAPVYNKFMDAAAEVADKVELIHPARFLFNAGSTPKAWNDKMLNSVHFKVLCYEEDASKVFPTTDDNARFKNLKTVLLDQGRGTRELEIEGVKFFKNMVILKFKGIDDRNDVERMRQAKLLVTRENAVELGKDEYFIADLIGIQVVSDEGEELGTISDVLQTGANDVYVVSKDGAKDLLIPAIHACIQNVDVAAGQMEVHLLPGLR